VLSPFVLNNNKRVARFLLREKGPPRTAIEREEGWDKIERLGYPGFRPPPPASV